MLGSLQSGLVGDHRTLFAKAILDGVISIVFAATMGWGVMGAAATVFVYQGSITLLAGVLAPLLSDVVIAELTCVGSLLLIAVGSNLIGITKLKVMNSIPAIFLPIIFYLFL